jgi:hypothetical protein
MNNLYFYLLLSVILYLLFTRVLENYIVSQENFDPSLVPVSSIVTLAKVAQKLVNGNGTLTNPGNLQIGASTGSPGNLTVTGNNTINGNTTLGGTLGVTGATTLNTLGITGATTVGGTLGVTGNTTVGGTLGVTGATTLNTLGVTGATTVGGTLGVTGATTLSSLNTSAKLTLPHSVWHQSNDGKNRLYYGNNSHTYFGTGDRYYWRANNDTDLMQLDGDGNLNITGKLKFNGLPAMIYVDFSGSNLGWNNDYGWVYDTQISGNYQAVIGWWHGTVRWESYFAWLRWSGTSWWFIINNVRDGSYTRSEIKEIRVYGYHNNFF